MAVCKKRLTNTRSGKRRSHLALKKKNFAKCSKCGELVLAHQVCLICGTYKDNQIIDFTKRDKKEKEMEKKKK